MYSAIMRPTLAARSLASKSQYDLYEVAAMNLLVRSLKRVVAAISDIFVS